MYKELMNFILNIPHMIAPFLNWLITPIGHGIDFPPLGLFTIAGFGAIFLFHVIHLVNPLG